MGRKVSQANPTELSKRLRRIRRAAEIDARSLSEAAGGSHSVVYQIERGLIVRPNYQLVARLASLLGTTGEWLGGGPGRAPTAEDSRRAFATASRGQQATGS